MDVSTLSDWLSNERVRLITTANSLKRQQQHHKAQIEAANRESDTLAFALANGEDAGARLIASNRVRSEGAELIVALDGALANTQARQASLDIIDKELDAARLIETAQAKVPELTRAARRIDDASRTIASGLTSLSNFDRPGAHRLIAGVFEHFGITQYLQAEGDKFDVPPDSVRPALSRFDDRERAQAATRIDEASTRLADAFCLLRDRLGQQRTYELARGVLEVSGIPLSVPNGAIKFRTPSLPHWVRWVESHFPSPIADTYSERSLTEAIRRVVSAIARYQVSTTH